MDTNRTYTSNKNMMDYLYICTMHYNIIFIHCLYSTMSFILVCMAGICSILGCFFLELSSFLNSYRDMEQYARSVHFVKGVNNEIYNIYGGQFKNTVGQFIQEPRKNIENIVMPFVNNIIQSISLFHDPEVNNVNIKLLRT